MPTETDIESLSLRATDRIELLVADVSLARALFDGIPAARLLGRIRLASDENDARLAPEAAVSTWDIWLKKLLGDGPWLERVRRAVARHTRVAFDEGPLVAREATVAALVWAAARASDADASLAEILAVDPTSPGDQTIARACGVYDERLVSRSDKRAALFEACVRLATHATIGPMPWQRVHAAAARLGATEFALVLLRASTVSFFPRPVADETPVRDRRMTNLDRAEVDRIASTDPRELANIVGRA
jgi:hypothetical protein